MQVDILNIEGKKTGRSIELPEEIFGVEPNNHVIYLAVKQYLAAQRQGTHKVKTRAEVKGASRKLHKQKGTGGARKGNIRNPLYKGGGTIFGPKPHSWSIKLNRKVKDLAKISALSIKAKENNIIIVEDLKLDAPKTKQFVGILKNLNINVDGRKTMFITPEYIDNVYLSLRNIPTVDGAVLSDINTYDIMNSNYIVFTESAAKIFTEEPAEA
ncbi:large subunit ribosomal protein L4 [Chitinophaga terrae (ex Kim and Jung 2007)]|jgi:large subunit ribosomal protein L4|uniref:Large ribosomal subunit protein uL4 n=1 Tax=Chitinophaga terrae (ex Kim and Jung 2007) TaxID=408074 RepID=A0A1H4AAH5_9BACT|nr:50S ribosomal protein L4 [Chitinophaga terrae (ex Kim and Jung 2007)]MDQ0105938.1 large subunit ribosomal protein L4 [Chitinophaga terrae (ex Kim and Jung 2007)]GEP90132.1 50S ribosomal protein L4 [Chitinophaga terrae (ex Kim and Jung 2007)]SEA32778.1 large subunit ribosomal protein L4 [Chitinophaga terrae (ex Kim and Jung 2007)]